MNEQSRRKNERFNAEQIILRARVDPERLPTGAQNTPLSTIVNVIRVLFLWIIQRVTAGLRPTDLVRLFVLATGLDNPISTRLLPVNELTIEGVLAAVMKVLQSKDSIMLDEGFTVDAITIRRDIGGGRAKVVNVQIDRLRKKSVISIPFDDEGLCCAKAILVAIAHLDNDKTAMQAFKRRDRPTLMNRARSLHEDAGVPLGPCAYTEVAMFEEHLKIQIVVFSTENLNRVRFLC